MDHVPCPTCLEQTRLLSVRMERSCQSDGEPPGSPSQDKRKRSEPVQRSPADITGSVSWSQGSRPWSRPKRSRSHLLHDGILRVFGLDDGGLHKVTFLVVTAPAGDEGEVRGGLGVVQPPPDPSEGLEEDLVREEAPQQKFWWNTPYLIIDDGREEGAEVLYGLDTTHHHHHHHHR